MAFSGAIVHGLSTLAALGVAAGTMGRGGEALAGSGRVCAWGGLRVGALVWWLSAHYTAAVVHTAAPHTTSVGTTSASLRIFDVSYLVVCIIRISNV
jgi:hypothetical protein